jgi:hypothetical protein
MNSKERSFATPTIFGMLQGHLDRKEITLANHHHYKNIFIHTKGLKQVNDTIEMASLVSESGSSDSHGSCDYTTPVLDGKPSWRCEGATRISLHLKYPMSVVSDISGEDFDDSESDDELNDTNHLTLKSWDSEFDVMSTDDDFTNVSFVSDDDFDLDEALNEEEEVSASTIDTLEEARMDLRQVACRPIQTQVPQNSLNHVSWHNRDEFRKRQACPGVRRTYSSSSRAKILQNGVSRKHLAQTPVGRTITARSKIRFPSRSRSVDEEDASTCTTTDTLEEAKRNLKRVACRPIKTQVPQNSLNHVTWHNRDDFRKRQACPGVRRTYSSSSKAKILQNGVSRKHLVQTPVGRTITPMSKIRFQSRSRSADTVRF